MGHSVHNFRDAKPIGKRNSYGKVKRKKVGHSVHNFLSTNTEVNHMRIPDADIAKAEQMDLLTYLQIYEPGNLKRVAGNEDRKSVV